MPVMDEEDRERPEGAIETSLWCNGCMLPSACRWPVKVTAAGTDRVIGNMTVVICVDCGRRVDDDGNPVG
jgi:hypothetical protein